MDKRSTTTTNNFNKQPVVKKTKTNSKLPPPEKNATTNLSTAITSKDQNVTGVTNTAIPTPISGTSKFDIGGINSEKTDTTSTITSVSTVDDKVATTTTTSASLLSPKQTRVRRELSSDLVNTNVTKTRDTKRTCSGRSTS